MGVTSHAERVGAPGAVVRHGRDGRLEMVNLIWGLEPVEPGGRLFEAVRAEGRTFARERRCLVPASEFLHSRRGRRWRFTRTDGDWFYLAGIWRPASRAWPAAYAALTIAANADVEPYAERQMAVIPRDRRMDWLDAAVPEPEVLQALPAATFRAEPWDGDEAPRQAELSL